MRALFVTESPGTPGGAARCGALRVALFLSAWLLVPSWGSAQTAGADETGVEAMRIFRMIEHNRIVEARERVAEERERWEAHPIGQLLLANLDFHEGRYEDAIRRFESLDIGSLPQSVRRLAQSRLSLVQSTWDVVREYVVWTSDDGMVEVRHAPGRDEVLLPWIHETLRDAWYTIGYDLGHWPAFPIRVEVYPRASVLAAVSPLTEEAIATSGTIALCKYNKLMLTSPRATYFGYGWRTTLAHEYVHQVVSELTGDRVPIWLHEALAKFLERRWTGEIRPSLDRSTEGLLARRVRENRLVTFDEMHPSMALLPSQEDAATAYAQVFTLVDAMVERRGRAVLRELMVAINEEDTVEEAVARVMGEPFDVFYARWHRDLRARDWRDAESDFRQEIVLRDQPAGGAVERWSQVDDMAARDHLRLGELLRARNAMDAALVAYGKAELLMGSGHPLLQGAMARIYLERREPERVLEVVDDAASANPEIYRLHLLRGSALNQLGRWAEAREALIEAVGINPFDPRVFQELALAEDGLGHRAYAERARRFARLVQ